MSSPADTASRRERKKERTRQEIYAAAMKLFADRSFDAVTVEEICERADVARATFFAHFPTKASLLLEYGHSVASRWHAAPRAAGESCTEQLAGVCGLIVESWFERPEVMEAMVQAFALASAQAVGSPSDELSLHDLVSDILRRGRDRGEFREGLDARVAARVFLSSAAVALAATARRRRRVPLEELQRDFLELVLHGIAMAPRAGAGEIT